MFQFRTLGIPVTVDGWFLLGMFFIYSWTGGGRAGMFAAAAIAVFTLIHELGHALTARRYGCTVEIRLNLLMGWASFSSPRPLSRTQRVVISLAGPFAGLASGFATLALVHWLMRRATTEGGITLLVDLWRGVVWAAVIISLLNLLPMWPLDGGHVVQKVLEWRLGEKRSLRAMAIVSLGACAALVLLSLVSSGSSGRLAQWRIDSQIDLARSFTRPLLPALWSLVAAFPGILLEGLLLLPIFCAISSYQLLRAVNTAGPGWIDVREPEPDARRRDEPRYDPAALSAEREGWSTGAEVDFPRGWSPSPWLRAMGRLRANDPAGARAVLAEVVAPGGRWIPPEPRQPELRWLVPLLPQPLPVGDRRRSLDLLSVLGAQGDAHAVGTYAGALYAQDPDAEVLYRAAAGLANAGAADTAMAWLQRAATEGPDADRLARDPGFAPLHDRLDFQQLLVWARQQPAR